MTEMVFGATASPVSDPIIPRWWRTIDRWSLACIVALFVIGLLLALAASVPLAERNNQARFYYVQRQAGFGFVAILLMLWISMKEIRTIRRFGVVGFVITFVVLLLLPVIGTDYGKGATRWLSLGFGSIQPSEFLKPMLMAVFGWFFAASYEEGGPPGKLYSAALAVLVAFVLTLQPDFGQAALVLLSWGAMYFIAGAPWSLLAGAIGMASVAGYFAYHQSEHFARRIDGFLSAEIDPRTQIGYATNAIQEGGFFGVGLGEGSVKWQLPDAHTDFIIAVAAEEYGFQVVAVIITLYVVVLLRSLARLRDERDAFARLTGTGLVCSFGLQAFINLGVAVRILPAKGMTLPFVSYGGSSLLASGIAMGMLLALTRKRPRGSYADILARDFDGLTINRM